MPNTNGNEIDSTKTIEIPTPPPTTLVAKSKGDGLAVAPTTTEQQDMTLEGQRRINLIWEYTQAIIAILVVLANMVAGVVMMISVRDVKIPETIVNALFLIVGFYFSRTNHANIGGVGVKTMVNYEGR